jgi:hypothetical protein
MPRFRVIAAAVVVGLLALGCDEHGNTRPRASESGRPGPGTTVPLPSPPPISRLRLDEQAWQELWQSVPGTSDRQSVPVRDLTSVRSGDFVVGNFVAYRDSWDGTLENSKLAYTPLHSTTIAPLTVTAAAVGTDPIETLQPLQFLANAWSGGGWPFYSTGTVLPHRGNWRLVAEASPNWGCFELTL